MTTQYKTIVKDGLWDNNGVLAMLLGLCPTMAMTTSATNGLGMGLGSVAAMLAGSAAGAGIGLFSSAAKAEPVSASENRRAIAVFMVFLPLLSLRAGWREGYKAVRMAA